eukprot:Tbor_TRINITY_DN5309_c0_g1::TRINITY_DN5309_c0_g1_i2::g.4076::m.4076
MVVTNNVYLKCSSQYRLFRHSFRKATSHNPPMALKCYECKSDDKVDKNVVFVSIQQYISSRIYDHKQLLSGHVYPHNTEYNARFLLSHLLYHQRDVFVAHL